MSGFLISVHVCVDIGNEQVNMKFLMDNVKQTITKHRIVKITKSCLRVTSIPNLQKGKSHKSSDSLNFKTNQ